MLRVFSSLFLAALVVAGAAQAQDAKPALTRPSDGVPPRPVFAVLSPAAIPDPHLLCTEQDRTIYQRALQGQIAVADANVAIGQAYAATLDARVKTLLVNPTANADAINRIRAEMEDFDTPMMASFLAGKSLKADLEAAPAVIIGHCVGAQMAAASVPTAPANPAPARPSIPLSAPPAAAPPVLAAASRPAPVIPAPVAPAVVAAAPAPVAAAPVPAPAATPVLRPSVPIPGPAAVATRPIAPVEAVAASSARPDQELVIGRPAGPAPLTITAATPAPLPQPVAAAPRAAPAPMPAPAPASVAAPVATATPIPRPSAPPVEAPAPRVAAAPARSAALDPATSGALPARTVVWRTKGKSGQPVTAEVSLSPSWSLKGNQLVVDWSANRPGGYAFGVKEGGGNDLPDGLDSKADEWVSYVIVTLDSGEVLYLKRPDFVRRNYLKIADSDRVTLPRNAGGVRKLEMVFGRDSEAATAVWDFR